MLFITAFLAAATQCAASIHPATALDVARVESGFNPWAIAEIVPENARVPGGSSVISHLPTTRAEAVSLTTKLNVEGRRFSVGLMQISSTNFRHYGVTARELLDPCTNLSVFERIFTDCYRRGHTLKRALSCYYSGNFDTGQRPESAFNQTSYVQRIGYTVPSTREDRQTQPASREKQKIHYPTSVLRGELTGIAMPGLTSPRFPDAVIRGALYVPVTKGEK